MNYESKLPDETPATNDIGFKLAELTTSEGLEFLRELAKQTPDDGIVTLAVPDFDYGVAAYERREGRTEDLIMRNGGARSIWNLTKLHRALNGCGFDLLGTPDGGAISREGIIRINARKFARPAPQLPMSNIRAVMSMPRVSWTTTNHVLHMAAAKLGIDAMRVTGVFWGQCLERAIEEAIRDGVEYILTVDYDSVFDAEDIVRLWQIMHTRPDIAALCPLQVQRDKENCLFTLRDSEGRLRAGVGEDELFTDAIEMNTGHFGLTLIRVSALEGIPRPLFYCKPAPDGSWGEGRVDDDIHFWNQLRDAGRLVALCPRVRIGHLQLVISWPDENSQALHQYFPEYSAKGRPSCTMTF